MIRYARMGQQILLTRILACAMLTACSAYDEADLYQPLDPGSYYEIDPDIVREILFSAADFKLFAYRWTSDENFHIVVLRPSKYEIEQCDAGERFRNWFDMITRMPIGRKLAKPVDLQFGNWATLELIDATVLEGTESRLRLPDTPSESIVWQFGSDQYPVEWDSAAFARLRSGCTGLS